MIASRGSMGKQESQSVVVEVAESVSGAAAGLDEQVDRLGGTVGGGAVGGEVGEQLGAPGAQGAAPGARLRGRGGRPARVGGMLAWAGVALGATTAAVYVATTDDEAFPLDFTFPLTMLSVIGALVLLGIAVRRAGALAGRWRSLPLAMVAG